jgi:hypothetical protein
MNTDKQKLKNDLTNFVVKNLANDNESMNICEKMFEENYNKIINAIKRIEIEKNKIFSYDEILNKFIYLLLK